MIRVLTVDASPAFRALMKRNLAADGDLEVIEETSDAEHGVQLAMNLRPEVVAIGAERGRSARAVEAVQAIMAGAPMPVIVLHDPHDPDADSIRIEASRAGAVAVEAKPPPTGGERAWRDLRRLVRAMSEVKLVARRRPSSISNPGSPTLVVPEVVAIGASTGGPPAVSALLGAVPHSYRGSVLVAQHLAPGFTEGLARWLQLATPLKVIVVSDPCPLSRPSVILPPDGMHLVVDGDKARAEPAEPGALVPSADRLFTACALTLRSRALGILLTGMGADGALGLKQMRLLGAWTIVQDESTSVVFGMPAAAAREGAACEMLPLPEIARALGRILEKGRPAKGLVPT